MDYTVNRYIYIKQPTTVLINPHFTSPLVKSSVYINPNFGESIKPKIHFNPNLLKNIPPPQKSSQSQLAENKPTIQQPRPVPYHPKVLDTKTASISQPPLISRTKIVRNVCVEKPKPLISRTKIIRNTTKDCPLTTPFKKPIPTVNTLSTPKLLTRTKLIRNGAKFISRTKLIKVSPLKSKKIEKTFVNNKRQPVFISKTKLIRENKTNKKKINKKKFIYVNRFTNINVLLKQNQKLNKSGYLKINGVLYKKSVNSLCRADKNQSKYKIVNKNCDKRRRNSILRVVKGKLKMSNVPCSIYRKTGKCKGHEKGTCIKIHNPDQVILCPKFLQGACLKENCSLSHKVSPEKMPTCKYYLEGLCAKDNCPYLHVKISPKANICKDFLEGFCKKGAECELRHQFLCPNYESTGTCNRVKCPYPHRNITKIKSSNKLIKKIPKTKKVVDEKKSKDKEENVEIKKPSSDRYYKDSLEKKPNENNIEVTVTRPKLGILPNFIPI